VKLIKDRVSREKHVERLLSKRKKRRGGTLARLGLAAVLGLY